MGMKPFKNKNKIKINENESPEQTESDLLTNWLIHSFLFIFLLGTLALCALVCRLCLCVLSARVECVCWVCVLSVRGGSDVPPWMYMRVFFAVGLPKKGRAHEHSRFHVIRPYPTRYSMRSLQSQHCLPVFKKKKKVDAHRAPAEISLLFAPQPNKGLT